MPAAMAGMIKNGLCASENPMFRMVRILPRLPGMCVDD